MPGHDPPEEEGARPRSAASATERCTVGRPRPRTPAAARINGPGAASTKQPHLRTSYGGPCATSAGQIPSEITRAHPGDVNRTSSAGSARRPGHRDEVGEPERAYALHMTVDGAQQLIDLTAERALRRHHPELFEDQPPTETTPIATSTAELILANARGITARLPEADEVDAVAPSNNVEASPYLEGRAFVSRLSMTAGSPDRTELHQELVGPVRAALLEEYKPVTASTRMLVEAASTTYGDWAMYTSLARGLISEPGSSQALQRYSKLAQAALKTTMTCIDMLRRPNARTIQLSVDVGGNAEAPRAAKAGRPGRRR